MKHRKLGPPKLNRPPERRDILIRNLVSSLLIHGQITTTVARAKATVDYAEKVINWGKRGLSEPFVERSVWWKRASQFLMSPNQSMPRLFDEIAPRFRLRDSGYTRMFLKGNRDYDHAPMALVQLVDGPKDFLFDMNARIVGKELGEIAAGEHLNAVGGVEALDYTRAVDPEKQRLVWKWRKGLEPSSSSAAEGDVESDGKEKKTAYSTIAAAFAYFRTPRKSTDTARRSPTMIYTACEQIYSDLPLSAKTKNDVLKVFRYRDTEPLVIRKDKKDTDEGKKEDALARFDRLARKSFDETLVRLNRVPSDAVANASAEDIDFLDASQLATLSSTEPNLSTNDITESLANQYKFYQLPVLGVRHGPTYGREFLPIYKLHNWNIKREIRRLRDVPMTDKEKSANVHSTGVYVPLSKSIDQYSASEEGASKRKSKKYTIPHSFRHSVWQQSFGSLGKRKGPQDSVYRGRTKGNQQPLDANTA